jgi:hypothetical protein
MTFLDKLRAISGDDEPISGPSMPKMGPRTAVSYTGEFRRIESLPRRQWENDYLLRRFIKIANSELKTDEGQMELWRVQGAALKDIVFQLGAFLPIGVGQGKALISLLAPMALTAKRPILFVPAQLRGQTINHVIPKMERHWKLHPNLKIIGYSELSLAKNVELLDRLEPDLIILDECHSVANLKAGRTRRLVRYFREHPGTICVAMSGTISHRSIRDFAHIIRWCLKQNTPLPEKWYELCDWADAIDEKVPDLQRVAPGALLKFCNPGENVRQGFRRRLVETPGVVATSEDLLRCSLQVIPFDGIKLPSSVSRMIQHLRNTWTTPNGDVISEAVDLWRCVRELALGFYYRWEPPAPKDWLKARAAWKKYVREILRHNRRQLDTELQVWNECKNQEDLDSEHPWVVWKDIKDSFKPKSVAEWIDDFAIDVCSKWLDKNEGICWVEHTAFGLKLQEVSGKPYFGAGDDRILDCGDKSIIASQNAHGEGKNLQRYSKCLITSPMSSGKKWEQVLGRIHRDGQEADEVVCETFIHVPELLNSFGQALADARYLEDTFGNKQKLNYCDLGDFNGLQRRM